MITVYENVASISSQMLDAARRGDWDQLSVLERACSEQVGILKGTCHPVALSTQQRDRKVRLIQGILENDRLIREITDPWMSQLSTLMQSTNAERKLNRAYGA